MEEEEKEEEKEEEDSPAWRRSGCNLATPNLINVSAKPNLLMFAQELKP